MKKTTHNTVLLILMCFLVLAQLSAGGRSQSSQSSAVDFVTVEHNLGTVRVPRNPERVVVFTYDTVDILDHLGVSILGLPKSNLPSSLARYNSPDYTNVGTLFEPLYEVVYGLQPDVIFISARQAAVYDQLSEIAPVVYTVLESTDYLGSLEYNWNLIGSIFGKTSEVTEYIQEIQLRAQEIKGLAPLFSTLFLQVNDGAMSVYGPGSRFGMVYETFGFKPADGDIQVSTHGQSVTFEYLSQLNPEILFVLDRGAAIGAMGTAHSVLDNPIVRSLKAYQNNRIIYVDTQAWYLTIGGIGAARSIFADLESALTIQH
jgi:iron complex transport system substrate-binding protein